MEQEFEIHFSTEEIEKFLWVGLMKLGYVPSDEEVEGLADLVFDYIADKTGAEVEDV